MHKEGYYSSGEFAKKANVTVRTIRYYDKQNILKPSLLTEDGVRFYTDSDFTRLQQILLFKYLGFSLEDIRNMTIGDSDYNILLNSLNLQFKLIPVSYTHLAGVDWPGGNWPVIILWWWWQMLLLFNGNNWRCTWNCCIWDKSAYRCDIIWEEAYKWRLWSVSYTHLDVYKRQDQSSLIP